MVGHSSIMPQVPTDDAMPSVGVQCFTHTARAVDGLEPHVAGTACVATLVAISPDTVIAAAPTMDDQMDHDASAGCTSRPAPIASASVDASAQCVGTAADTPIGSRILSFENEATRTIKDNPAHSASEIDPVAAVGAVKYHQHQDTNACIGFNVRHSPTAMLSPDDEAMSRIHGAHGGMEARSRGPAGRSTFATDRHTGDDELNVPHERSVVERRCSNSVEVLPPSTTTSHQPYLQQQQMLMPAGGSAVEGQLGSPRQRQTQSAIALLTDAKPTVSALRPVSALSSVGDSSVESNAFPRANFNAFAPSTPGVSRNCESGDTKRTTTTETIATNAFTLSHDGAHRIPNKSANVVTTADPKADVSEQIDIHHQGTALILTHDALSNVGRTCDHSSVLEIKTVSAAEQPSTLPIAPHPAAMKLLLPVATNSKPCVQRFPRHCDERCKMRIVRAARLLVSRQGNANVVAPSKVEPRRSLPVMMPTGEARSADALHSDRSSSVRALSNSEQKRFAKLTARQQQCPSDGSKETGNTRAVVPVDDSHHDPGFRQCAAPAAASETRRVLRIQDTLMQLLHAEAKIEEQLEAVQRARLAHDAPHLCLRLLAQLHASCSSDEESAALLAEAREIILVTLTRPLRRREKQLCLWLRGVAEVQKRYPLYVLPSATQAIVERDQRSMRELRQRLGLLEALQASPSPFGSFDMLQTLQSTRSLHDTEDRTSDAQPQSAHGTATLVADAPLAGAATRWLPELADASQMQAKKAVVNLMRLRSEGARNLEAAESTALMAVQAREREAAQSLKATRTLLSEIANGTFSGGSSLLSKSASTLRYRASANVPSSAQLRPASGSAIRQMLQGMAQSVSAPILACNEVCSTKRRARSSNALPPLVSPYSGGTGAQAPVVQRTASLRLFEEQRASLTY